MIVTAVACGAPPGPGRRKKERLIRPNTLHSDSMRGLIARGGPRTTTRTQEVPDATREGREAEGRRPTSATADPCFNLLYVHVLLVRSATRHPLAVEGRVGDHMKPGSLSPISLVMFGGHSGFAVRVAFCRG